MQVPWPGIGRMQGGCLLVQGGSSEPKSSPRLIARGCPSPRQSPPLFSSQNTHKLKLAHVLNLFWRLLFDLWSNWVCWSKLTTDLQCKAMNKVLPALSRSFISYSLQFMFFIQGKLYLQSMLFIQGYATNNLWTPWLTFHFWLIVIHLDSYCRQHYRKHSATQVQYHSDDHYFTDITYYQDLLKSNND